MRLAQVLGGEIVNADSRQVYRYMDIGTAKPTPEELALVPHHLISIINPDDDFSLAQYQELVYITIKALHKRSKLPILVGGTGQYVWAVLEGWEVPRVAPDPEFRRALEDKTADELYHMLLEVDPVAAEKVDRRNIRRVVRALEVYRQARTPFSQLKRKQEPAFKSLIIGLTASREEVYRRVDQRVDEMLKQGLVAEVERLVSLGYDLNLPAMSGVGYRQIGKFLKGELSLEDAITQIKTETHRIVRHQYAWFRLKDERIHWFDVQKEVESEIITLVSRFLEGKLKEAD